MSDGVPTTRMAHPSSGRIGYDQLRPPIANFAPITFMAHSSSGRIGYTPLRPSGWTTTAASFAPFQAQPSPSRVCAAGGACGGCQQPVGQARHYRCQACPEFRLCATCIDRHEDDPSFLPQHPQTHHFVRITAARRVEPTAASSVC